MHVTHYIHEMIFVGFFCDFYRTPTQHKSYITKLEKLRVDDMRNKSHMKNVEYDCELLMCWQECELLTDHFSC